MLVDLELAPSRQRARELIEEGTVRVDGMQVTKVAAQVQLGQSVTLASTERQWVGRGAVKLLSVIDAFGVDPAGAVCADLGSSTGGFTEVLLDRGAERVHAVDVGRNLLHWRLRSEPRVVLHEGVNARYLDALPDPIDLVVGDLSFISLRLILPAIGRILRPEGEAVVLVKPQFEVGRDAIGHGGRVRSDADRDAAIARVAHEAAEEGFTVLAGHDSGIAGAKSGNVEHFLHLRRLAD
ncbi:MAG: 23S rRNA (cytidine1920-2'-O)/16S rRNA (cytidine1409-2'-O)-methyltransferase [Myxococcota bacterium]|jgi:23S rRNA (cytidine1920-2'-O)/16S rRNA (cytidine1409-2'-O)-methyltransferase